MKIIFDKESDMTCSFGELNLGDVFLYADKLFIKVYNNVYDTSISLLDYTSYYFDDSLEVTPMEAELRVNYKKR